jgi:hypothetical protein
MEAWKYLLFPGKRNGSSELVQGKECGVRRYHHELSRKV